MNFVRKRINSRHGKDISNENGRMIEYGIDDDVDNSNKKQDYDYNQPWYSNGGMIWNYFAKLISNLSYYI